MTIPARAVRFLASLTVIPFLADCATAQCAPALAPVSLAQGLVNVMITLRNGDVVVGGSFTSVAGVPIDNLARWNGTTWSSLGGGVNGSVWSLAVTHNGDLVVGGDFSQAGGGPANRIARWNGSTWSTLGAGLSGLPTAITTRSNGEVVAYVNSAQALVRWNGSTWSPLPGAPSFVSGTIRAMVTLPNDDVVWTGLFTGQNPSVMRWNGTTAAPLGALDGSGRTLMVRANGELLAGGSFYSSPGAPAIARWTGSTWVTLGAGLQGWVNAITELANGDLVAGGSFPSATGPTTGLARWDGTTWSAVSSTIDTGYDLASNERGDLLFSGLDASSSPSTAMELATPPCPAAATTIGAGCTSTAGPLTLTANNLPWAGDTFVSTAIGFAPLSVALHTIGTSATAVPLPLGAPGCSLLVSPLVTELLFPIGSAATAPLAIPNSTSLAGVTLRTQVIALELDLSLNLVRTAATNALQLTIGAL